VSSAEYSAESAVPFTTMAAVEPVKNHVGIIETRDEDDALSSRQPN
jgi:hypothetical protein